MNAGPVTHLSILGKWNGGNRAHTGFSDPLNYQKMGQGM